MSTSKDPEIVELENDVNPTGKRIKRNSRSMDTQAESIRALIQPNHNISSSQDNDKHQPVTKQMFLGRSLNNKGNSKQNNNNKTVKKTQQKRRKKKANQQPKSTQTESSPHGLNKNESKKKRKKRKGRGKNKNPSENATDKSTVPENEANPQIISNENVKLEHEDIEIQSQQTSLPPTQSISDEFIETQDSSEYVEEDAEGDEKYVEPEDEYVEEEEVDTEDQNATEATELVESPSKDKQDNEVVPREEGNDKIELHAEDNKKDEDIGFCYKKRKKKLWWTIEETEALVEGVKKHGRGNWKAILMDNLSIFKGRRCARDLSDKMRIIDRSASNYVFSDIVYTRVDENGDPILRGDGSPETCLCKFPHQAAVMMVNSSHWLPNSIIRISCDDEGTKAVHIYKVTKSWQGKIRVRKMSGRSKKRVDGWY